jgi:hypothetical protein
LPLLRQHLMVAQQSLPTPQLLHLPVVLERYLKQEVERFQLPD